MIILQQHSLTPIRKVIPEELSLKLTERSSTATMIPAEGCEAIQINTWIRDETDPGKNIVWRVSNVQTAFAAKTTTFQMEHIINTLRDTIMFGEHSASTARAAVQMILGMQSDWALGEFEYDGVSNDYKFDGNTLFDALETVCESLSDPVWTYDMTVYPFRLNIKKRGSGATSEMRASRNLRTITKTIDKSGMYTRMYPIGHDDMHITGEYVEKNTDVYGIVSKVETDSAIEDEGELRRWAEERLKNHCEPNLTIDVDGLELASSTGEAMDRFKIGQYCRVPLMEYGTEILETITALTYQDKIHQPEAVRVTMSNKREDVNISLILADTIKSTGKSARTGTKQGKKDHAWFEDTDDHVSMCAIGIIGTDAQGNPNWVRMSELVVDGKGVHSKVESLQGDMVVAYSKIEENEDEISLEVGRREAADSEIQGQLSVHADEIEAEVTHRIQGDKILQGQLDIKDTQVSLLVGNKDGRKVLHYATAGNFPNQGNGNFLYYDADAKLYYEWKDGRYQACAGPDAYINAGGIVSAINSDGTTSTKIKGNKVFVGMSDSEIGTALDTWAADAEGLIAENATIAQATIEELTAAEARIETLETDTLTVAKIAKIATLNVQGVSGTGNFYTSANMTASDFRVNDGGGESGEGTSLLGAIKSVWIDGPTNNEYSLKYRLFSSSTEYNAGSFSRATTLRVRYGGGAETIGETCEVIASPQQTVSQLLYLRVTNNEAYISTLAGESWTNYAQKTHGKYDAGWAAAYGKVSMPTSGTTSDNMVVKVPTSKVNGEASTTTFYVRSTANDAYISTKNANETWTNYAHIQHGQYNAGANSVAAPSISYTAIGANSTGSVAGTASISNGKSNDISLTMEISSYRQSPQTTSTLPCVNVKNGNTVVGRISIYNEGSYKDGWNDACDKITRDGDAIIGPKKTTDNNGNTGGTETKFTATLDKGTAWGKAKLHVDRYNRSGNRVSQDTYGYEEDDSVTDSGGVKYVYKATNGYWGWTTEPSISWS